MRWNTDNYEVGIFVCDTSKCNRDLGRDECAHVCTEEEQGASKVEASPMILKEEPMEEVVSKCYSCEEDDKPTLCKEDESNQKLVDCNDKVIGCVETKVKNVTNPELYHVMRHCVDRNITSSSTIKHGNLFPSKTKRTMIPIKGYDDEEYARGCLQYYIEQFMVDMCICDEEACNKDCECEYGWCTTTTTTTSTTTPKPEPE